MRLYYTYFKRHKDCNRYSEESSSTVNDNAKKVLTRYLEFKISIMSGVFIIHFNVSHTILGNGGRFFKSDYIFLHKVKSSAFKLYCRMDTIRVPNGGPFKP